MNPVSTMNARIMMRFFIMCVIMTRMAIHNVTALTVTVDHIVRKVNVTITVKMEETVYFTLNTHGNPGVLVIHPVEDTVGLDVKLTDVTISAKMGVSCVIVKLNANFFFFTAVFILLTLSIISFQDSVPMTKTMAS